MYQINIITYLHNDYNYRKILVISPRPMGKIKQISKQISPQKLSPFETYNSCRNQCIFAIMNPDNINEFLCVEQTDILINFLYNNNYMINESLTNLMRKSNLNKDAQLLFYISEN